jgi:hypothetical protein
MTERQIHDLTDLMILKPAIACHRDMRSSAETHGAAPRIEMESAIQSDFTKLFRGFRRAPEARMCHHS